MFESFTPNAFAVAASARAFAKELGHGYVGREHMLHEFASGVGGDTIKTALEICGLSEPAVRAAIDVIDGGKHPHAKSRQKTVNPALAERHTGMTVPMNVLAQQRLITFAPNAETVLKMADQEATTEPTFEDILYVLLREAGRSSDERRITRVIELIDPHLELSAIKWVIEMLKKGTPDQAQVFIDRQDNTLKIMKRTRHALMHVPGAVQTA